MTTNTHPRLSVSANEAAAMLGVSPRTLANWRTHRVGPAFVRVGRVHSRTLYHQKGRNHGCTHSPSPSQDPLYNKHPLERLDLMSRLPPQGRQRDG